MSPEIMPSESHSTLPLALKPMENPDLVGSSEWNSSTLGATVAGLLGGKEEDGAVWVAFESDDDPLPQPELDIKTSASMKVTLPDIDCRFINVIFPGCFLANPSAPKAIGA
jgi:hypothetical protein